MKNIFKLITISLFSFFLLTGCSKKEEKIVGEWEMAWIIKNENPTYKIIWNIKANGELIQTKTNNDSITEPIIINGSYNMDKQSGVWYISIFDIFDMELHNGKYRIVKLTNDLLVIAQVVDHEGEYAWNMVEFTRK